MDTFATGARRDLSPDRTERYDLITPWAWERLAKTYAEGSVKYGDRNWEKGIPASNLINHAIRHIVKWLKGDRDEDHLAHAVWNLCAVMHFEETRPDLIDVPTRQERRLYYLASPYSHEDPGVCGMRYQAACEATAWLLRNGYLAYSPIAASHPVAACGLDGSWEAWREVDLRMLRHCDAVLVLTIDGWKESRGVAAEIEYARRHGKPVSFLVPVTGGYEIVASIE